MGMSSNHEDNTWRKRGGKSGRRGNVTGPSDGAWDLYFHPRKKKNINREGRKQVQMGQIHII